MPVKRGIGMDLTIPSNRLAAQTAKGLAEMYEASYLTPLSGFHEPCNLRT
jgi:hypothetical protein